MAQSVHIFKENDTTKITVDGNEIQDVISYELSEDVDSLATLTLKIAVLGNGEVGESEYG